MHNKSGVNDEPIWKSYISNHNLPPLINCEGKKSMYFKLPLFNIKENKGIVGSMVAYPLRVFVTREESFKGKEWEVVYDKKQSEWPFYIVFVVGKFHIF